MHSSSNEVHRGYVHVHKPLRQTHLPLNPRVPSNLSNIFRVDRGQQLQVVSASEGFRGPGQTSFEQPSTSGRDSKDNGVPIFPSKIGNGKVQKVEESDLQQVKDATSQLSPEEEKAIKRRLWYLAIKPPMYSVCIVPVVVAAAAAYNEVGIFLWRRTGTLLLGSILIIAWLNLSNDAFDYAMGVDGAKPESVVNLTGNRQAVLWTANVALVAGGLLLWRVIQQVVRLDLLKDPRVLWMLSAAIALGYMYQGPPFRLSFKGLGEPITFITFGPLATSSFYLAQVASGAAKTTLVSHSAAAASVLVGLTTASILFCSHFHQVSGDKAAGKKSPIVRLGSTKKGLKVLKWSVAFTYASSIVFCLLRWLPWTCALTLPLSIPLAGKMLRFCSDNHKVPALIRPLKLYAVKWHSAVGFCLMLGLLAYPQVRVSPLVELFAS